MVKYVANLSAMMLGSTQPSIDLYTLVGMLKFRTPTFPKAGEWGRLFSATHRAVRWCTSRH